MATTQEKWQIIANRGLQDNFDPATRAKFDVAVNRGLITFPEPVEPIQPEPTAPQPVQSAPSEEGFFRSPADIGAQITGAREVLTTIGTGLASEVEAGLKGIEGLVQDSPEAGAEAVAQSREEFAATPPETEAGKQILGELGAGVQGLIDKFNIPASFIGGIVELVSGQGIEQAEETIRSIQERGLGVTAGERVLEETGSPLAATAARIAPEAVAEVIGGKGAGRALTASAKAGRQVSSEVIESAFQHQTPARTRIAELLAEGSNDISTAKFELIESIGDAPRAGKDAVAREAIKQGFDEGVIAAIRPGSATDKAKLREMVNIMEKGKKDQLFALTNRPGDVAGDSLLERFNVVRQTNRRAGKELDGVANKLKGKPVDSSFAVETFLDDLDSMGVTLNKDFTPNFKGSDVEGLSGPEEAIRRMVKRLTQGQTPGGKTPDAFELHRMKRFIDENVTFGKGGEKGISGRTEGVLKNLRRNLDQTLDQAFPEYNRVNSTYSETIDAIDSLQDVAGRKMDLTGRNADRAVGTLLRRLMSNAQSRVPLLDAVVELDRVAAKSVGGFDDDILRQVLFADELDRVFGPVARTSFQGQIKQGVQSAAQAVTGSKVEVGARVAGSVIEKARGINQAGGFKAIKEFLKK